MADRQMPPKRTPEEIAEARRWAEEMRRKGEAGELKDDIPYLKRRLAEEKRNQKPR
jgi:hypothetical protein